MITEFKPGGVYTHAKFVDVKIYVRSRPSRVTLGRAGDGTDKEGYSINVIWLTKAGNVLATDSVVVPEESLGEWSEC